jgi:hypothetical protein
MTGRRKGKEALAEPCAPSYDSRQAASAALRNLRPNDAGRSKPHA